MKSIYLTFFLLTAVFSLNEIQAQNLPHQMTANERLEMPGYLQSRQGPPNSQGVLPPSSPVRTIGEWEELQGLLIAWTSYTTMLRQIVEAAKTETRVYIVCSSPASVISNLATYGIDTVNITFLNDPFNSVWSRDYGPWSAYTNDVDTLVTIDWIYNRPRPLDDAIPPVIANALGTPLYQTTTAPWDLIHTGGNFMTDGLGTGFSSKLIVDENPGHTIAEIDTIMSRFMGITRYIKMDKLPYDQIHHIDMHMKLLDEETILMGQYPAGIADGPQIEANLLYVISNFNSVYGTPYKVIRMPMPSDNGLYPNNGGDYFTYTNSSFINKTLIYPTYGISSDTTALRIYREALPGYKIVGINSTASIGALGALHCITKELGTADPLLIVHQPLPDTWDDVNPYGVIARIQHKSGIQAATLYYRTDTTLPYQFIPMSSLSSTINTWGAQIPAQPAGTTVYYYIEANSVSGKTQVRPLPAPSGYWHFNILQQVGVPEDKQSAYTLGNIFPNPSKGITCIPFETREGVNMKMFLEDITGRMVKQVFNGKTKHGNKYYFFNSENLPGGVYILKIAMEKDIFSQKIIVR